MGKMTKGLPPIIKQTLSKKIKYKNNRIKRKRHTDNRSWNNWKSQLHWNRLEWVNPRIRIVRKNSIQLLNEIKYIE